ncbi:MAG: hypothetical protein V1821_02885 [bacterium]
MPTHSEEPQFKKIDIESSLRAIYEEDGAMPDLTKLERRKSRRGLFVLLALTFLGLLAGTSWVGFLLFSPLIAKTAPKLSIEIIMPETVASLEPINLVVSYQNASSQPIAKAEVHLSLPTEFQLATTAPAPTEGGTDWILGSLNPGEKGTIELTGAFIADPGSVLFAQAISHYRPANFNSDFQDVTTKNVLIQNSKLGLSLEVPTEVIAGEKTKLIYRLKNPTKFAALNLLLETRPPENFLITASSAKALTDDPTLYPIEKLEPESELVITQEGVFSADHADAENVAAALNILAGGFKHLQVETVSPIRIVASELVFRTLVNGLATDQNVDFGGVIRLSTFYKNNGSLPLKDLVLTITLDGTPDAIIDWAKFDADTEEDKTFKRSGESIILNKKLYKSLAELAPGTEGSLSYSLPLLATAPADAKKIQVSVKSQVEVGAVGTTKVSKNVETTPFTLTLNSDAGFADSGRYFDEDGLQLGTGPLPPTVSQKTRYSINWTVTNSVHELQNLSAKTLLPEGVTWTGKFLAEAGTITFDEVSKEVKWTLARMSTTLRSVNVSFEVELTPKDSQVDSFAPLTTAATFSATDALTQAFLTRTTSPLTTELIGDKTAEGKGLVQKQN